MTSAQLKMDELLCELIDAAQQEISEKMKSKEYKSRLDVIEIHAPVIRMLSECIEKIKD